VDHIALNLNEEKPIRHFFSEPGIHSTSTSISWVLVSKILDYIKTISFHFVSSPLSYIFLLVILTKIRIVYVVRHTILSPSGRKFSILVL
jgi:hypothetical protein